MVPADVEGLRAENARLAAAMKNMMLAMKKQSAEVKLAQQSAETAEDTLAASSNGSLNAIDSLSGNEGASSEVKSILSLDRSLVSNEAYESGGVRNSVDSEASPERDYLEEREALASEARRNADEKDKFEAEREALASEARRCVLEKEKLEAQFRELRLASDQIVGQLMEKNRSLESELKELTRTTVEEVQSLESSSQQHKGSRAGGTSGSQGVLDIGNVDAPPNTLLEQQLQEANDRIQMLEAELEERVTEAAARDANIARPVVGESTPDLSVKLQEVNKRLDEEITKYTELDVKYTELDAKFGRLLKRSKQRIQEVQKEKEDVQVQFQELEEKAAEAVARQATLQANLTATRKQAGDALRNLDSERQQLSVALRRAKQDTEEMRQAMEAKEHKLIETRSKVEEKELELAEVTLKLKESETSQEVAMLGLKETYQKVVESYEQQLAEAAKELREGEKTLSSLQAQLADRDAKLAEVETTSSGELVRLGALLDTTRGEIQRLMSEHEKETETKCDEHKSTVASLTSKLEASASLLSQVEMEAGSRRSKLESELEGCRQILSATQVELATARSETKLQAQELAAYKVRAHALLQRKEAALQAAQDSSTTAALESSLKEAKAQAASATTASDQAMRRLDATVADYQRQLNAQAEVIEDANLHLRELSTQLDLSKALVKSQHVEYERRLHEAEESLSSRPEVPAPSTTSPVNEDLERELTALRIEKKQLKGEFESYKEMIDSMMASKDEEIMRLVEEKNSLQRHLSRKAPIDAVDRSVTNSPSPPLAEQQILSLARLQAQKEEEVARCLRHIEALQEEVKELELENRLRVHQVAILKEEYQNSERNQKRSNVDMTYVKNVILKLLETVEVEALLPVIATLLQFSPEELRRCQEAYKMQAVNDVPVTLKRVWTQKVAYE